MNTMNNIKLIRPDFSYAQDLMLYRQEFLEANDSLAGCGILRECDTPEQWFARVETTSDPATCPAGLVPSWTFFAIDCETNKLVGIIDIRHHINHPVLGVWGGHIGYSVRPGERRKGYATQMLQQVLPHCKTLGLSEVLVTCDVNNIASEKTILKNGGQFEKEVWNGDSWSKRYWIKL